MNPRNASLALTVAGTCCLGLAAATPAGAEPRAEDDRASVSVFHGIPGLTVDVYANGKELIPNFKPGTLTEPQKLDAGSYDIEIFADGEGPDGKPALQKTVEVAAGGNATVAAHLDAQGKPALDAFVNDVSAVDPGKARLTVRHIAAAPAVDVRAGGTPVVRGLENPDAKTLEVAAGTVRADVVLAGTGNVVLGPADLDLAEGTSTVVYAWGSAKDDNLALKVQTLKGMETPPGGVNAGESDLMASGGALPAWAWVVAGAAALGSGLAVRKLAVRRG
ncbi:DUF4397 domain-containing protein [Streptomyces sp. SCUT-3]|uniref:DUF4397 domain-containing protein n=1 Tax=Streptomyces sp. SCUT-3 TaxID=2684469 RepID=UPI000CBBCC2B|nr:DUF4397 domain-containing protein [Streptomyces sp. SCUT-3]PLW73268.1 hypothetical protein C0036_08160 [Streptomyces sp. DJ]QMV23866.1 DUF4397 domain-containing protein [Streptomyces sp. SCUT-3]